MQYIIKAFTQNEQTQEVHLQGRRCGEEIVALLIERGRRTLASKY